MKLSEKKALVTGGSQGLGSAIVTALLNEGANVAFCGRNGDDVKTKQTTERARHSDSDRIHGYVCDVSKEEEVSAMITAAEKDLGGLDILINNAGIYGPIGRSEEVDFSQWAKAIEINLYGTFFACRGVIPIFRRKRYGKIINISGGGATNPLPRFSAYAASKAAMVRLSETLAEELREDRIDVNAIAPGALKTRLMSEVLEAGQEKVGKAFYAKNEKWAADGGTPLELGASLCVYLASNLSDGITGKLISAQWDPWQNMDKFLADLQSTDIYCLRRITPRDRGKGWGEEDRR